MYLINVYTTISSANIFKRQLQDVNFHSIVSFWWMFKEMVVSQGLKASTLNPLKEIPGIPDWHRCKYTPTIQLLLPSSLDYRNGSIPADRSNDWSDLHRRSDNPTSQRRTPCSWTSLRGTRSPPRNPLGSSIPRGTGRSWYSWRRAWWCCPVGSRWLRLLSTPRPRRRWCSWHGQACCRSSQPGRSRRCSRRCCALSLPSHGNPEGRWLVWLNLIKDK